MFVQKFSHQLIVAFAAVLMSSIAVSAAVAPEGLVTTNVNVVSYV